MWQAVLLSMNIEPIKRCRMALRQTDPKRYQLYLDRCAIAVARLGADLKVLKGHLAEGPRPTERCVSLPEFLRFAKELEWQDLDGMKVHVAEAFPPELSPRQSNNVLQLLNSIFQVHVPGYDLSHPSSSAASVEKWLTDTEMECPVSGRSLETWIKKLLDQRNRRSNVAK